MTLPSLILGVAMWLLGAAALLYMDYWRRGRWNRDEGWRVRRAERKMQRGRWRR